MKTKFTDSQKSEIIEMALSDHITFDQIKRSFGILEKDVESIVRFNRLTAEEIETYLDTGDWKGKAGGYGIQGPASAFVPWIRGSYSGIVGLPLAETYALLKSVGLSAL